MIVKSFAMDDVAGPLRWAAMGGIAISPRWPVGGFHHTWEPKDNAKGCGQAICWNRNKLELFARSISVMNFKWDRDRVLAGGGMPLAGRAWELANRRVACGLVENTDAYRKGPSYFMLQKAGGLYCSVSGFRFARVSLATFPDWQGVHHYPETAAHPVRRREASRLGYMIYNPQTASFAIPKTPTGTVKPEFIKTAWENCLQANFVKAIRSPCGGAVICWTQEDGYALMGHTLRYHQYMPNSWTVWECNGYCPWKVFAGSFSTELGKLPSADLVKAAGYDPITGKDILKSEFQDVPF